MKSGLIPQTVLLIATVFGGDSFCFAQGLEHDLKSLVALLDHPSFHVRSNTSRRLIAIATTGPPTEAERVAASLRSIRSGSIESRLAAREILRQIAQIQRDREIERLLNPHAASETIRLEGWPTFVASAGDDMAARKFFALLSRQYPILLRTVDSGAPDWHMLVGEHDPYHLAAEDGIGWGMLLLLDLGCGDPVSAYSQKVATALGNSAVGPRVTAKRHADVLRRLIDAWVRSPKSDVTIRERLLIAMRYQCRDSANRFCERIFADREAPPSTIVTALLCAAALGRGDVEAQAHARLADRRTAHVWQLIPSRQTRIRTQVADVALAILLHQRGIDPRTTGFVELQADPILVFRDHSLGFPDDSSRRSAYESSQRVLNVPLVPSFSAPFDR